MVVDVTTQKKRFLIDRKTDANFPAVSPMETSVALISGESLWIVDIDGENPRKIASKLADFPIQWTGGAR